MKPAIIALLILIGGYGVSSFIDYMDATHAKCLSLGNSESECAKL